MDKISDDSLKELPFIKMKIPGYQIVDEITKTNTSRIFKASRILSENPEEQLPSEKYVAVKISLFEYNSNDSIVEENEMLSALKHEKIIRPIELGKTRLSDSSQSTQSSESEYAFMITDFKQKGDLLQNLTTSGKFCEDLARTYWRQILEAVKYLHDQDIVHRDIKLQNVVLSDDDTIELIDFGFAKRLNSDANTMSPSVSYINSKSDIKGTQGYI